MKISINDLRSSVPSIFAKNPSPKMSDRYAFVSTYDLISPLLKTFDITLAAQRLTRRSGRDPNFTRHELRLRPNDTKIKPMVGGVVPEVSIINSHDGQSRISIHGGLFRFICSNGLVIPFAPGSGKSATFTHLGDAGRILAVAKEAIELAGSASDTIRRMIATKMSDRQMAKFANAAALAAYGEDWKAFDPALLLAVRREEDKANNVWNVMNRVQENVLRGGVKFNGQSGRGFATRGVTHIGRKLDFNESVWELATGLAKAA